MQGGIDSPLATIGRVKARRQGANLAEAGVSLPTDGFRQGAQGVVNETKDGLQTPLV